MQFVGPVARAFVALAVAGLILPLSGAADSAPQERGARLIEVAPTGPWPDDLLRPEGKTRWDLTGIPAGAVRLVSWIPIDGAVALRESAEPPETDIMVESAEEAARRFVEAGGRIVAGPFDIKIGKCVVVADPWGNQLVLLDSTKGLLQTDENGYVIS